jgi:hypothetical protein
MTPKVTSKCPWSPLYTWPFARRYIWGVYRLALYSYFKEQKKIHATAYWVAGFLTTAK